MRTIIEIAKDAQQLSENIVCDEFTLTGSFDGSINVESLKSEILLNYYDNENLWAGLCKELYGRGMRLHSDKFSNYNYD